MASAVLFDLDRTLIDVQTHTDYGAALTDVEALFGTWDDPPTPPTGWDGPTRRAMGVLVGLSGDPRWREVSDVIERHEARAVADSTAMPGLREALERTDSIPRAVVTLLPQNAARAALRRHGVGIEALVPRRPDLAPKPAPDQVLAGAALLGVDATDVVMIGDSTWDEAAASAAGSAFVGVTNGLVSEFGSTTPVADTLDRAVEIMLRGSS